VRACRAAATASKASHPIQKRPRDVLSDIARIRITLLLFALALLPVVLTACGKGGGY